MIQTNHNNWTLVCHLNYGAEGKVVTVKKTAQGFEVIDIPSGPAMGQEDPSKTPVFLGLNDTSVLLMDQLSKTITQSSLFPSDADPSYAYPDYANQRLWFVNDGDKKTGNDPIVCGNDGSPITIIEPDAAGGRVLASLCVGRGHHVTTFVPGCQKRPSVAFVSNLLDGTIFVLGNDSGNKETFLNVIATVNLCERDKEKDPSTTLPNNAFPHGMFYSSATDRVYNLNNGYGTIAVIHPETFEIEQRIDLKKCSNLLLHPNQRFAVGKGADRKSNPKHVMGRISIVDLEKGAVAAELDIQDIYPSTYRFSPDGQKLYVTTAATGKDEQKSSLKINKVLIYDTSNLPHIHLTKELDVGLADCGRRALAYTEKDQNMEWVFIPNPTDGTLSIINGATDSLVDTVTLGAGHIKEVLFSFWHPSIKGS